MHLFDFNRALTTRKILPAQTFSGELEAPRMSLEIPDKGNTFDSDSEEKKKNPNVVARLMGLDALPDKSTRVDHSRRSSVSSLQIPIDQEQNTYPVSLPKSRSVSETYTPLPYSIPSVSQKLGSRSHSFREHPQEKQLEEFKRDFEARQSLQYSDHSQYFHHQHLKFDHNNVQQRLDDARGLLYGDKLIDSPRTPASARKRYTESTEFLDALEYLKKNGEILLKAHRDSNPSLGNSINPPHHGVAKKTSSQEQALRPNIKELAGSLPPLPLHSRPRSPSRNSATALPATIVVLKPNSGPASRTAEKLKNYKGKLGQSSKDTSTDFRKIRDIPRVKEGTNNGNPVNKMFKEPGSEDDSATIPSPRRKLLPKITTSNRSMSANGDEASSAIRKLPSPSGKGNSGQQSSPRIGKRIAENSKEEKKVAAKKDAQSLRRSEVKNVSSRSHSVPRPNKDIHDRSASTGYAGSSKSTTDTAKKKPDPQNLISKRKIQSKKNTLSSTQSKEKMAGPGGKGENAQDVAVNDVATHSEDKIESISQEECLIDNEVDGIRKQPCIEEKSEFPSPISVLDGHLQQDSSSPLNTKEVPTDFSDPSKKLSSLKSDGNDTSYSDQSGRVFHENEMSKLSPEDGVLAARTELSSDKNMDLDEMQGPNFECLDVEGIAFPKGKEASLLYVRNLLVSAGFNNDNILETTRWSHPSHPIDPQVFDQLEDYYNDAQENNPCMKTSNGSQGCKKPKLALEVVNRKLLFDLVNEILGKKLKPFLDSRPWIKPAKLSCRYMSTGKKLLQEVWDEISRSPEVDCKILEDVEALISKDMHSKTPWAPDNKAIEKVGFEVEHLIFEDLLQEFVFDLLSR